MTLVAQSQATFSDVDMLSCLLSLRERVRVRNSYLDCQLRVVFLDDAEEG
jgi:hypothetical protein